jgi:hypothetical protein
MPDPAFIVEGHMEQLIVQKLCPRIPVQRLEINGDDAEIAAIVDRIESIFRILNNRFYPVCVVFDREGRQEDSMAIVAAVEAELVARQLDASQFRIAVCDRMIENWILADKDLLAKRYNHAENICCEGLNGKGVLRKICEGVERYRETTVGVRLFQSASVRAMYEGSASFKQFVDKIDFECWWELYSKVGDGMKG